MYKSRKQDKDYFGMSIRNPKKASLYDLSDDSQSLGNNNPFNYFPELSISW
jgi:hypothetical protein